MHFRFKKIHYKQKRFWLLISSLVFFVWFAFCLPKPLFNESYATVLVDRDGGLLSATISGDEQWRFPESDSVPYAFQESIRCFEDEYFFFHPGVNPVSLFRALWQNLTSKKVVSGGSTISMQVIRLACKHSNRTFFTKIYEMILALRLELSYSKEEILGFYASHAPFGGNVVGLEAASWRYYNRPSHLLSWGEMSTLAVLPNAPSLIRPGKNQDLLLAKRNRLLSKMYKLDVIDSLTCILAQEEPLPGAPFPLPNKAQHLLNASIKQGYKGAIIRSTIQSSMQNYTQQLAKNYVRKYKANHIENIAILVLDTKTGEILSYIGNVQMDNLQNNSFVDLIPAQRSSGSILKPFLYAGMLSEGSLLPNMLVADIPTFIGSYRPENFEKTFDGAVPASQALAKSLNIPAVKMLQVYGVEKFHSKLKNIGFTTINRNANNYGLSLILGGAEVSLIDVTSAYASMARSLLNYTNSSAEYNILDYKKASFVKSKQEQQLQGDSYLSAGAIWCTMQALSTLHRPWAEIGWEHFASARKIAWKTGTSFGNRDAWCVGVTPEYTVGIWVGNATGEGRPGLTGLNYASPVMFEVMKYLSPTEWFEPPYNDLIKVGVCKNSGARSTDLCPVDSIFVPTNGIRAQACTNHKKVFLNKERTYRVSNACYPISSMVDTSFFVLPTAEEWFYKKNHPEYKSLPPYLPNCSNKNEAMVEVLNPQPNAHLVMPKSKDSPRYIFEAVHRNKHSKLFWHVDGIFLTETIDYHKIEYEPTLGKHKLVVLDEQGNTQEIYFTVE